VFRQIIKIILIGPVIFGVLWIVFSDIEIQEILPSGVGAVVMLHHPIDSVEKAVGSEFVGTLSKRQGMEQLKDLLNFWENVRGREPIFTLYQLLFKKVYFSVPADLTNLARNQSIYTMYVEMGFVGQLVSFFGNRGFFRFSDQVAQHRGYALIRRKNDVVAYVRNFMIIGQMTHVVQSIDAFEGGISSLQDIEERYHKSLQVVDETADVSAVLLSSAYFRKGDSDAHLFDPRLFLSAPAIERAVLNLYLEEDGPSARLVVQAKPGKLVSPYTIDKPGEFRTITLPDADTFLYAALRLERPADLSTTLFDMFTADQEVSKLRQKLTVLLFNSFLEHMGSEIAVVMAYDELTGFPVVVFEVKQTEAVKKLLDKYAKVKDAQMAMHDLVMDDAGKKLVETILTTENPQQAEALLAKVPADQRAQVEMLVDKMRSEGTTLAELENDRRQISLFGRTLYYRLVDDHLILAPTSEAANRYEKNLTAKVVQPEFGADARLAPIDGPYLGYLNLAVPLSKSDPQRENYAGWLATRKPHLLIGSQVNDGKLIVTAHVPFEMGLTSVEANASIPWLFILIGGALVLTILFVFLVYVFLKAVAAIVLPREKRP